MSQQFSSLHSTDEDLWRLAGAGQEDAFTQLMQRYAGRLVSYGRRWTTDDELIKDCIQDVFTELWLQRDRANAIESVRAYLLASVRNRIGRLSQRALRTGQPLGEDVESEFTILFSVEEQWIADEESRFRVEQLNTYINRLSARQREVIYLKFYQNLTQSQIAAVMGIHYQSVSNLLQRTLADLRSEFSPKLLGWLGLALIVH